MRNELTSALEWRCIGPHRGGRVVAVAGDPRERSVFYFGASAGGVWKTLDGGVYWENVSDGFFNTAAVGAIAVADSDSNVVYVGTGESCIRNDVSHGDGVYRSTDGGASWKNMGLKDTRHIARIRVHPQNPDLVYVAALGHAFGPNAERGVFRSKDGGATWERALFKSDRAGAIDLSMDPHNPRVLYASVWEAERSFWEISSGGPDSGLYRSTDGGDTWVELSDSPGMPEGIKGRIGVAVSPAKTGRVWALIEADDGGLFRSDDGGAGWEKVADKDDIRERSWYYTHVFADPQDADTVWGLASKVWRSSDGGRTFTQVTTPHGDNHDLWIDPRDPNRMIEGNDGGACVSFNGGATWTTIYNQPTSAFYHVTTDNQFPYRVYGTQQDNSSISVPSRSYRGAILPVDWLTHGMSESGDIAVKPDDPNIVYSAYPMGILNRYDHRTGQVRVVSVWPEADIHTPPKEYPYRFSWRFPIVFSPHDPNALYVAGNVVFKTTDDGTTWEAISPDLTRNDSTKQEVSGGPITMEGVAEVYCTIYAFAESPHERGVLWAGSDDGLVHVSRDSGGSWQNVTPPDLPEWTMVHSIEVSPHDPGTAYVAATKYKLHDNMPYLFKTNDYGASWQKITDGIPDDDFTRVVREDPARRGLLYAGTETGVFVSLDDGESWQSLRCNLPVVPVHDMVVKENDLVAGTHGRSFWVLDDLTPLHQIDADTLKAPAHLFRPRPAHRLLPQMDNPRKVGPGKNYCVGIMGLPGAFYEKTTPDGETTRAFLDSGKNPPYGVVLTYYLREEPQGEITLTLRDPKDEAIKTFSTEAGDGLRLRVKKGMNRFVWNMRYPEAREAAGEGEKEGSDVTSAPGPLAAPGRYRVELGVGGDTLAQDFEILVDPRSSASQEDLEEQFAFLVRIRDKLSEVNDVISRVRNVRGQVEEWERHIADGEDREKLLGQGRSVREKLSAIENELTLADPPRSPRGYPARLDTKLSSLSGSVSSADWVPTKSSYAVFEDLSARVDTQLQELQRTIDTDLAEFLNLLRELQVPTILT